MASSTHKIFSGTRLKKPIFLTAEQSRELAGLKSEMDENHREIERLSEETRLNLAKTKAVLDELKNAHT